MLNRFGTNSSKLLVPNLLPIWRKFRNFAAIQQDVLSFSGQRLRGKERGKSGQRRVPDSLEGDVREGIDSGEENNRPLIYQGVRVRR